jgi:hypothetical protein
MAMTFRKLSPILFASLLLTLIPINSTAAAKKAEKCESVGAIKTIGKKEYICSFSGSKKVWKKQPKSKQVIQAPPKTFQELVGHKSIPQVVWDSFVTETASAPVADIDFQILVGPQTTLLNPKVKEVFANTSKLFSKYSQPKKISAYYYQVEDVEWAKKELANLKQPENKIKEVSFTCGKTACRGATAGAIFSTADNKNDYDHALIIFGVPGKSEPKFTYHLGGGIEAHEFSHTVQTRQFADLGKPIQAFIPTWFVEGHAHLAGNISSSENAFDYQLRRKFWLFDSNSVVNEKTVNGMYESMAPGKNIGFAGGGDYYFQFVYTFGYLTVELLASLRGIDSPMQLIYEVSKGKTFDEAFNKIYGMDWQAAAPILAKAVVAQYSL